MKKTELIKRNVSALMAISLMIMSVPAFSASVPTSMTTTQEIIQVSPPVPLVPQEVPVSNIVSTTTTTNAVVIPAGTTLRIHPMGTVSERIGAPFTGSLVNPVLVNNTEVLPAGSQVRGEVVAVNQNLNTIEIREVSLPSGDKLALRGSACVTRAQTQCVTQPTTLTGSCCEKHFHAHLPYLGYGCENPTAAGRIVGDTIGGAVFGGAVGTLSGLIIPAVYNTNYNMGTGAVRGLAWGAATGAGLGLVGGIVSAMAQRDDCSVTKTSCNPCQVRPVSNCCNPCGVKETPVAYPVGYSSSNTLSDFNIILQEPVQVPVNP